MKYYKQIRDESVEMLMETLEMQTQLNLDWSMKELLTLCRDISFIDDDPLNTDYSDSTYLILAELYSEFRQYGQLVDVPDALRGVHSFTMDEASKQELISALMSLRSGVIEGRTRVLTEQWEREGTLQVWQRHIEDLTAEIADVIPEQSCVNPYKVEAVLESRPQKEKPRGRKKIALALGCALLLLALVLLAYQNTYALYRYLPATDEDACVNAGGVMMRQEDMEPFSGRMRSGTDDSFSIYTYKDGLLDGLDVVYYEGAVKEVGHWKEGKQEGLFLLYSTSGRLLDEANFKNGERHGLTRQFDPESGRLVVEGSYHNGQMDGVWTQYYPNTGSTAMVQTYRDGVLDGPAQQYYEDGQIQVDMNYVNDVPTGPYKAYYSNGQLQVEGTLENGEYSDDIKLYAEDGSQLEFWTGDVNNNDWDSGPSDDEITITEVTPDTSH